MRPRSVRLAMAGLLAAGCLGLAAACGVEDNGGSSNELTASCKADVAIDEGYSKLFSRTPALQSSKPLAKAQLAKFQASYDKFVAGPLANAEKNSPEDIAGDIEKVVTGSRKFRATGDSSQLDSPGLMAAVGALDTYYYDNCDDEKTEVKAREYAFEGLESSYSPGLRRFKLENTGKEVHEMSILRRKPGVTESFDQLLELPEEEAESKVDFFFVGGADRADPGLTSHGSAADLTPGDYIAVCFISKGTTSLKKEGNGPPHFTLGQKKEFKVE